MRAFLLAATICAVSTPTMAQKLGEIIDVGGWKIERQTLGNGQVCSALREGSDNTGVAFGAASNDTAFMMLVDSSGKRVVDRKYTMTYQVDLKKKVTAESVGMDASTVYTLLGSLNGVGPFFTSIEEGNSISLEVGGTSYEYSLEGSKNAFGALAACITTVMTGK